MKILVSEFKCLVYNFFIDVVKVILFVKFKKLGYFNVCYIIDCIEIFIEILSDLNFRVVMWLDYKYYNIVKLLVLIILYGFFNFLFKVWGGRILDVYLIRELLFYDIIEFGDEVMVDCGFIIVEDFLIRSLRLYIFFGKCG